MANAKEQLLQNCGLQSSPYAHQNPIRVEISNMIFFFIIIVMNWKRPLHSAHPLTRQASVKIPNKLD